jgi:LacI family transcriptional regulator
MMSKKTTISDVAKAAGVSVATVSRALTGNYPVAEGTMKRIQRAVEGLDYVANSHARALAGGGQRIVAFVLESSLGPGFADAAHGVAQESAAQGRLSIISATEGDAEHEWASMRLMREQGAEAIIAIGGIEETPQYLKRMRTLATALHAKGSRLVLCGRPTIGDDVPVSVIDVDHEGGAYAATMFLLSKGHSRILVLTGRDGMSTTQARVAGYNRALVDFGITPDPTLIEHGTFSRQFGYEGMRRRLSSDMDFTAVFAHADVNAAGAMTATREHGLSIPDDLSIIGFDDIELARDLNPELTTVQVPYEHLGILAVRTGLGVGQTEDRVTLGVNLIVRNSVKQISRQERAD